MRFTRSGLDVVGQWTGRKGSTRTATTLRVRLGIDNKREGDESKEK